VQVGVADASLLNSRLQGLRFEDHQRLAKVVQALRKTFPAVARLPPQEWQSLFGSLGPSNSGGGSLQPAAASGNNTRANEVHSVNSVEGIFSTFSIGL